MSVSSYGCASSSRGGSASTAAASASVPPSISRFMLILKRISVGSWRMDSAPAEARLGRDEVERPCLEREARLEQVHQPPVRLVERDRRAVAAGAELGPRGPGAYRSQAAASLA